MAKEQGFNSENIRGTGLAREFVLSSPRLGRW